MWPNYVTWTKYAYEHPETKMMLSVGGATFSAIWRNLLNANNVEAIAQVIVDKLNTQFPVYSGNFANPQEQIGTVELAGVDLDVEAGGRLTPQITDNIVALVKAIKRLAPDKLITFAGFSVGADPEGACTVPGSIHCGEDRDLLQRIGHEFDWVNVMAYDAGLDYANTRYKEAMNNYADLVGKEKVFLGINTKPHWGVWQPESVVLISEKTQWTFDNDFGGVMVWVIDNYQRPDGNDIYGILNIMSNAMPQ